jgi:hypothetical protein
MEVLFHFSLHVTKIAQGIVVKTPQRRGLLGTGSGRAMPVEAVSKTNRTKIVFFLFSSIISP